MNVTKLRGLAGVPSWGTLGLHFPYESELNTHLGMKAVASSSENKLPVKSDVPFLSGRKRAKAGCAAQESGVPHRLARQQGPGHVAAAEKPGLAPGHALLTCLKGLWKTEASLTTWSEKFK